MQTIILSILDMRCCYCKVLYHSLPTQETQNRNGTKHSVCILVKALMTLRLFKKLRLEFLAGTGHKIIHFRIISDKKKDTQEKERRRQKKSGVISGAKTTWNLLPRAPSGTLPHQHTPPITVLMMSHENEPLHSPT